MNGATHTSTGHTPYFAFFGRHPPRLAGHRLPGVDGTEDEAEIAHRVIRETHHKMTTEYQNVANRRRGEQKVEVGALVWIRKETTMPGTCRKLNPKWEGPYTVVEVVAGHSVYGLRNPFTGKETRRAAAQVKPYFGSEEWLVEPVEKEFHPDPEVEILPPRMRRAPRRLIEEC
ncbi:uncharacterized protein LOC143024042 [Oratosquilla oratoria]|uniref:uncharacterized protein LOC143024042 n=1 Tax=Oratosquilla oratoria TaxID=337810 RepID=UPI003F769F4C